MKQPGIFDVAQGKKAQLELQHQANFARFNPNPVLELSATGEINYCNDAAKAMARELGRENPAQMLPPDTAAMVRECLAVGTPNLRVETQIGPRVISWSFFPVKLTHTVHCYGGDVPARKQGEEVLRLQNATLEAAANAIVIADQSGNILWVNAAFTDLTGYTAQEVLGKNPRLLKSGKQDEAFYRNLWQTISSGQVWRGELTNRRKNGSLYAEEMTITPVRSADGVITRYIAIKQDVTKRKRVEEALRASQQIIEGIINAIPARVFWKDKNLVYLGCNAVFARDAGFADPKDIIGKDDYQMGWRAQAEKYRGDDREVIESGSSRLLIEEPQTTPEGNTITLLSSKIPLRSSKGEISGMIGTYLDITARKQMENALRASEGKFRSLFESSRDAIMTTEPPSWKFTSGNPAAVKMLGAKSEEEFILHGIADLSPDLQPDGRTSAGKAKEIIETILREGSHFFEWTFRRLGGEEFRADMLVTRMEQGGKVILQATVRDITERKRAETALRESNQKFQDLFDSCRDAILITEPPSWKLTSGNPVAVKMFGVKSKEDFVSYSPWDLSPERQPDGRASSEKAREMLEKMMREGSALFEWTHRRIGGQEFPATVLLSRVESAGTVFFLGTVRDITESKRAQLELENLQKQLVEASRRDGMAEIATNVLHNVGNVLNSVNISTDLIIDSVKKSKASSLAGVVVLLQEHAHDLGAFLTNDPSGQHVPAHLARLSEHLMAEEGKIAGELDSLRRNVDHIKEIVAMQQSYAMVGGVKETIDVTSLVEDSLRLNEDALRRHGVEVIRELEKVPPMNVEKHKILQILVNLVRNAKYACDESGRADRRLTVRLANGDGRVKISIIDNGIGIPPENLTHIFNYGFTTRKGSHGFGLHSSALAAKEMGGSLTARSGGPGQGADFTLELPCPTRENPHE
jgi:PAS domain S-box-containing protein